jgi:hypothetical protein
MDSNSPQTTEHAPAVASTNPIETATAAGATPVDDSATSTVTPAQGEQTATAAMDAAGPLEPDYAESITFLERFHPNRRWALTAISLDKKSIVTATFDDGRKDTCLAWLQREGATKNLYFSLGEIDHDVQKKAERTDILNVVCLHTDLDPRTGEDIPTEQDRILKLLNNPPGLPPPSVILFSGGGYQAFWCLSEPLPINRSLDAAEDAKLYNLQIEILLGADSVHDVSRVMRLPGTVNRPDAAKLKKGRAPALARVISFTDVTYPITAFTKAPLPPGPAVAVKAQGGVVSAPRIGTVKRLSSIDDLPSTVAARTKTVIVMGYDPEKPNEFSGRSEWLYYVVCALIRASVDDETIFSVITDPQFTISESVLDKGRNIERYALRQIQRAKDGVISPQLVELNDKFFVVKSINGKCRICAEEEDPILERSRIVKYSFQDFRNANCNIRVDTGARNKDDEPIYRPLGDWWIQHSNRKQFDRIIFAPGKEVTGTYNLWQGFSVDPKPGDCSLYLEHLKQNICRGNNDHFDYLIKWMARAVQCPAQQGESAVVFKGKPGTGKSIAVKTLGLLFGRHFIQVTNPKHVTGNFNAHLREAMSLR